MQQQQANLQDSGLLSVALAVWKRKWLFVACVLLGLGVAAVVYQRAPERHRAVARVALQPESSRAVGGLAGGASAMTPAFNVYADAELIDSTVFLQPLVTGGALAEPERFGSDPVEGIKSALEVSVSSTGSSLEIAVEQPTASGARDLANGVQDRYIAFVEERRLAVSASQLKQLEGEETQLEAELGALNARARELRITPLESSSISEMTLEGVADREAAFNEKLNAASFERLTLDRLRQQVAAAEGRPAVVLGVLTELDRLGGLPSTLSFDEALAGRFAEIDGRLQVANKRYEPHSQVVQRLREEVEVLADQSRNELTRVAALLGPHLVERLRLNAAESKDLEESLADLRSSAYALRERSAKLNQLDRDTKRLERRLDLIDTLYRELLLAGEASDSGARVLERATTWQTAPDLQRTVMLGLLAAVVVGLGLCLLLDSLDTKVRTRVVEPTKSAWNPADADVLGVLPRLDHPASPDDLGQAHSGFRDALDQLSVSLLLRFRDKPARRVLVTSGVPGEGKSFVAGHLAESMARHGKRVLLIDLDLRRPTQAKLFGIEERDGSGRWLRGEASAEEAVQKTGREGLSVLTAAAGDAGEAALLAADGFTARMDAVSEGFDLVIVDSGPVLAVPEVRFMAAAVDATLLVVREGKAERFAVNSAMRQLAGLSDHGVAIVVNAAPKLGFGSYGAYSPRNAEPRKRGGAGRLNGRSKAEPAAVG